MIEDRQEELLRLHGRYSPEPSANGHPEQPNGSQRHAELSDEEIVSLARSASNGSKFEALWGGDTSGYASPSEADLALMGILGFYTQDEEQLYSLVRKSGLYRPKWDRPDYRRGTIGRALGGLTETYSGRVKANGVGPTPGEALASPSPSPYITGTRGCEENGSGRRLKAVKFSEMPPLKERQYLVEGIIPEGYPAVLYGDGGTAKSMLALSLGSAVARSDGEWLGLKVQQVPVLYLDFELDAHEQQRRAYQLARGGGLEKPPDDLLYMSALGHPARKAFEHALEECREHNVRLLILDSLGPALEGDAESASDVIGFYSEVMEHFRAEGVSVLVVDHQSKPQPGQNYRDKRAFGSVFKGNLARSVLQVEPKKHDDGVLTVRLWQTKHNFGQQSDHLMVRLAFTEDHVKVEAVDLEPDAPDEEGELNATEKVLRALEAGPAYPWEIAKAIKLEVKTVSNRLSELRKQGRVEPTGERERRWEQVRLVSQRPSPIRDRDGDANREEVA